ncbi:MAG TPA: nucleotidyltransferase domain-containing protein, partial [bacterium]|nr:nucleotidyltransferase domain-containing protein [bacterium]
MPTAFPLAASTMLNSTIADNFDLIADLLDFQEANPFRVRAYRNGARAIRDYPESLAALAAEGKDNLTKIQGIGADLAAKIVTLVETGELPMLTELKSQIPSSLPALLRIPGVGPKKAAQVFKQLGIATLDELKQACVEGKVQKLKGFGVKTESLILQGIGVASQANERLYWSSADRMAQDLRQFMAPCKSIEQMEFAGSYRRGKETVGDLDLLVVSTNVKEVMDRFGEFPPRETIIARGDTKMSLRTGSGLQIDLRVVPAESFGAALQYFTGSKEHNVILRGMAKAKGLKINEYAVYRVEDGKETPIAGKTEKEVYDTLGLPVFPPEIREARQEFDWAKSGKLPRLI